MFDTTTLQMALRIGLLMLVASRVSGQSQVRVLAPSGDLEITDTDKSLDYIEAPSLAPAPMESSNATQADCITSSDIFWGSDFMATTSAQTSSASDCCKACKLSPDCTVWNWCASDSGCLFPPDLAAVNNESSVPKNTCLWKPRPVLYAGTLPLPPEANRSTAMKGWTSGIPINGSLIPKLNGFELHTGVELDYSVSSDFYCQGSTTTKPVCQLYGSAQGGAAACLNNPICRGYQICWSFPVWGTSYLQSATIRMKGGLGPLNTTAALQNPYCSVYTIDESIFNNPDGEARQYALRTAYNGTVAEAYYQYAAGHPLATANSTLSAATANGSSVGQNNRNRRLMQAASTPAPLGAAAATSGVNNTNSVAASPALATAVQSAASVPASAVSRPTGPQIVPTNFTTDYLAGKTMQAFNNVTFNFTQCYSNAATIRVTLQRQLFPLLGPDPIYSIHSWVEKPFRSSASVCCAFQDLNDIFFNLESGVIAVAQQAYIAINPNLTNAEPLRNYETRPVSIASPVIYIPPGQMNNPGGYGRQYAFPRVNSTGYVEALEKLYFSLSQVLLGDQICSLGFSDLESAAQFVGDLLSSYAEEEDEVESPNGIPAGIEYLSAASQLEAGSPATGCLVEEGAEFEGDLITTITGDQTKESCCAACWLYAGTSANATTCSVWVLDTVQQSCELRNSTAAANFQIVDVIRDDTTVNRVTGRTTSIQPRNTTTIFSSAA